jgi:hypothetical protein
MELRSDQRPFTESRTERRQALLARLSIRGPD